MSVPDGRKFVGGTGSAPPAVGAAGLNFLPLGTNGPSASEWGGETREVLRGRVAPEVRYSLAGWPSSWVQARVLAAYCSAEGSVVRMAEATIALRSTASSMASTQVT